MLPWALSSEMGDGTKTPRAISSLSYINIKFTLIQGGENEIYIFHFTLAWDINLIRKTEMSSSPRGGWKSFSKSLASFLDSFRAFSGQIDVICYFLNSRVRVENWPHRQRTILCSPCTPFRTCPSLTWIIQVLKGFLDPTVHFFSHEMLWEGSEAQHLQAVQLLTVAAAAGKWRAYGET